MPGPFTYPHWTNSSSNSHTVNIDDDKTVEIDVSDLDEDHDAFWSAAEGVYTLPKGYTTVDQQYGVVKKCTCGTEATMGPVDNQFHSSWCDLNSEDVDHGNGD